LVLRKVLSAYSNPAFSVGSLNIAVSMIVMVNKIKDAEFSQLLFHPKKSK
jgi:hypothetical protein